MSKWSEISCCCVCDNRIFKRVFAKKGRDFWRCINCGFEKQHPLPTRDELKVYYDASYRSGMYKTFAGAVAMKRMTASQRMNELARYCPNGRWLDVGCANGVFLELAVSQGIEAEGIDIASPPIEEARSRGLNAHCSTLEEFKTNRPFDVVTLFDVLEHVLDPIGFIQAAHQLLCPGGQLVITVPNQGSLTRRLMGRRWYFYIPEEHLNYFNRTTIRRFLSRFGFVVRRVACTYKPLSLAYSLTQFKEYNPLIYRFLRPIVALTPDRLRKRPVRLCIGEIMVIAQRMDDEGRACRRHTAISQDLSFVP